MSILTFLFIGLCAGWIAGNLVVGHSRGFFGNIVTGIIGAFVGGFIFNVVGIHAYGIWGNIAMSAIGATVLLSLLAGLNRPLKNNL